jgi:hypothetical protein
MASGELSLAGLYTPAFAAVAPSAMEDRIRIGAAILRNVILLFLVLD